MKVTENQLRLFRICSQAYKTAPETKLMSALGATAQKAFELHIEDSIKGVDKHAEEYFNQAIGIIKKEHGLTDTEALHVGLGLVQYLEVLKKLYLSWYIPVVGPVDQVVKLRDLSITLHYSGIGRTKEGAIRAWVFSPFYKQQDIHADIVHKLQHEFLKSLYKEVGYVAGQPAKIYVVGSTDKELRALSFETTEKNKMYQKELMLNEYALMNGICYPAVPCLNKPCMCR